MDIGMDRRIAQILLINLLSALIGALATILYLDQNKAEAVWFIFCVFLWLISALLFTYAYWSFEIYKDKPHRTEVFFWGLFSPFFAYAFLIAAIIFKVVPGFESNFKKLHDWIGRVE